MREAKKMAGGLAGFGLTAGIIGVRARGFGIEHSPFLSCRVMDVDLGIEIGI